VLAFIAGVVFLIGAITQAVNGTDLGHEPWFWLLTGLAALAFGSAFEGVDRSLLAKRPRN